MMKSMVADLIRHGHIQTTDAKAKELRSLADRMITLGKQGDLFARRRAARFVRDEPALKRLFAELGPLYKERNGGYTRIVKVGNRKGDAAPVSIIEFVDLEPTAPAAPAQPAK